jgi:L-threonylcarbamoyladenylate synthase
MRISRDEVIARLDAGEVVAVPTSSSFALAARIDRPTALDRLAALKPERDKPIGLVIDHPRNLPGLVADVPPVAFDLAQAYWPGPLTMVFKATRNVPLLVTAGSGSVGIRVPGHEALRALCADVGVALTATSANRPGEAPINDSDELARIFPGLPVWDIEDRTAGRLPSTVVDVRDGGWIILRQGAVTI